MNENELQSFIYDATLVESKYLMMQKATEQVDDSVVLLCDLSYSPGASECGGDEEQGEQQNVSMDADAVDQSHQTVMLVRANQTVNSTVADTSKLIRNETVVDESALNESNVDQSVAVDGKRSNLCCSYTQRPLLAPSNFPLQTESGLSAAQPDEERTSGLLSARNSATSLLVSYSLTFPLLFTRQRPTSATHLSRFNFFSFFFLQGLDAKNASIAVWEEPEDNPELFGES